MQAWTIRDIAADDVDAVAGVFRRASLSNDGDRAVLLEHPELLVWSPPPELRTRVAVDGSRVVGFASTVAAARGVVVLDDLFVDPDEMRRGIGRALVADAIARAIDADAVAVEVDANSHALEFYERVGFVVIGSAMTQFVEVPRMRLDVRHLASPA